MPSGSLLGSQLLRGGAARGAAATSMTLSDASATQDGTSGGSGALGSSLAPIDLVSETSRSAPHSLAGGESRRIKRVTWGAVTVTLIPARRQETDTMTNDSFPTPDSSPAHMTPSSLDAPDWDPFLPLGNQQHQQQQQQQHDQPSASANASGSSWKVGELQNQWPAHVLQAIDDSIPTPPLSAAGLAAGAPPSVTIVLDDVADEIITTVAPESLTPLEVAFLQRVVPQPDGGEAAIPPDVSSAACSGADRGEAKSAAAGAVEAPRDAAASAAGGDAAAPVCVFCGQGGALDYVDPGGLGSMHAACALYAAEVHCDPYQGRLVNLHDALKRVAAIKCAHCRRGGPTAGCLQEHCQRSYHYQCATLAGCLMVPYDGVFCSKHRPDKRRKQKRDGGAGDVDDAAALADRRKRPDD